MIETILNNSYYAAIAVFISQVVFIFLRTVNVIYTAERGMLPAIITGNGLGISWLISMSIGMNSVLTGQILPIIAFLLGGTLGTYWGIKFKEKKMVKK